MESITQSYGFQGVLRSFSLVYLFVCFFSCFFFFFLNFSNNFVLGSRFPLVITKEQINNGGVHSNKLESFYLHLQYIPAHCINITNYYHFHYQKKVFEMRWFFFLKILLVDAYEINGMPTVPKSERDDYVLVMWNYFLKQTIWACIND